MAITSSVSVLPSSDVHIDGLLHLATLAFAMTLAYLGFDRANDRAREGLEKALADKAKEIGDFLRNDERIFTDGTINQLRDHVGFRVRRSICMLLTLGNISHDIYDGASGRLLRALHRTQLFFAFRCYLTHWDLFLVKLFALLSGAAFFSLTVVTTFRYALTMPLVAFIFLADTATIAFIVLAAWHSVSARPKLDRRYQRWKAKYLKWADSANTTLLRTSERLVARPLAPKLDAATPAAGAAAPNGDQAGPPANEPPSSTTKRWVRE